MNPIVKAICSDLSLVFRVASLKDAIMLKLFGKGKITIMVTVYDSQTEKDVSDEHSFEAEVDLKGMHVPLASLLGSDAQMGPEYTLACTIAESAVCLVEDGKAFLVIPCVTSRPRHWKFPLKPTQTTMSTTPNLAELRKQLGITDESHELPFSAPHVGQEGKLEEIDLNALRDRSQKEQEQKAEKE